jgi:hypothetical protein
MSFWSKIKTHWKRRLKPTTELMVVEFDEEEIRIRVTEGMDATFNQTFRWDQIERVCFQDGGIALSDIVYVDLTDQAAPAIIFTEATGGETFFGALGHRKFFPEDFWRQAIRETGGKTHCWPPKPLKF